MSTPLITVQIEGAAQMERAIQGFRALIKDDSVKALGKGTRLVTLSLHREFRKQPPRPRAGSITAAAAARGFRLSRKSRSFITGAASAQKILGNFKSGYFRISDGNAYPVLLGARGKLLKPKSRSKRAKLLTSADQLKGNGIPPDAVRLNFNALATLRALKLREKAASGGYLSAQFLSYKGVRSVGETKFTTKDRKLAGTVNISVNQSAETTKGEITGFLEGSAKVAARQGIIERSLQGGAAIMQQDIAQAIARRGAQKFGRRS